MFTNGTYGETGASAPARYISNRVENFLKLSRNDFSSIHDIQSRGSLISVEEHDILISLEEKGISLTEEEESTFKELIERVRKENIKFKSAFFRYGSVNQRTLFQFVHEDVRSYSLGILDRKRRALATMYPRFYKELESFDLSFRTAVWNTAESKDVFSTISRLKTWITVGIPGTTSSLGNFYPIETNILSQVPETYLSDVLGKPFPVKAKILKPWNFPVSRDRNCQRILENSTSSERFGFVMSSSSFTSIISLNNRMRLPIVVKDVTLGDLGETWKLIYIDKSLPRGHVPPRRANEMYYKDILKFLSIKTETAERGEKYDSGQAQSVGNGSLEYCTYQIGPNKILIRKVVDGVVKRARSAGGDCMISMKVKTEYIPSVGLEEYTLKETASHWANLVLRPPGSLLLVGRINVSTSTLLGMEIREMNDLQRPKSIFTSEDSLILLENLLTRLKKLTVGNYLISHDEGSPIVQILRAVGGNAQAQNPETLYDLHNALEKPCEVDEDDILVIPPKWCDSDRFPYTFHSHSSKKKRKKAKRDLDKPMDSRNSDEQIHRNGEGGSVSAFEREMKKYELMKKGVKGGPKTKLS